MRVKIFESLLPIERSDMYLSVLSLSDKFRSSYIYTILYMCNISIVFSRQSIFNDNTTEQFITSPKRDGKTVACDDLLYFPFNKQ